MTSVGILHLVLVLFGAAVLLSMLADRLGLPPAVPLVLGGLVLALVPGAPALNLDPELILVLFLPPLLLNAAYFTVWRDFRDELRAITLLSLGAVIFTTASVAVVARWVLPSLPWAACFALGAVVSPPDAVSARAIFNRLRIPRRLQTVLEGESLVNDATGLVLYRFAVAAALSGTFSVAHAAGDFAWLALGGVGFGVLLGILVASILKFLQDARYIIVATWLSAYGAYLGAEQIHASGVLAVVSCGLIIGWRQHEVLSAQARSDSHATWNLTVFILEALVFVLIGLSLHGILERMGDRSHVWNQAVPLSVAAVVTVVLSRFLYIFPSSYLTRVIFPGLTEGDSSTPHSVLLIMSWSGMRGVVSLAAALALPLAFPGRDPVIFATFAVIVATVLLQGLTLGPLIRWLRVPEVPAAAEATLDFSETRVKVNEAAVRTLETIVKPGDGTLAHPDLVEEYRTRTRATERLRDDDETIGEESLAHFKAALSAVESSRAELLRLLDHGDVHESVVHKIEEELDLEEMRLRRLVESLPGDENSIDGPAIAEPSAGRS